jgi:hypothetical protein
MKNIEFIYTSILLLSVIFFIFSRSSVPFLIAAVIVILLSYYVLQFYRNKIKTDELEQKDFLSKVDKDITERNEISNKIVSLSVAPKSLKFVKRNDKLIGILTNLNFIKKFDKTRYSDILINSNELMKIYIYVLSGRYERISGITLFVDTRDLIIELLYSIIMIVPENMKHSYGFSPYEEIETSISDFIETSREMLEVLEKYCTIEQKEVYIPDTKYKPYNSVKDIPFP